MSGGICKDLNGAKCAENYCDYWDAKKGKCIKAVREFEMAKYYETLNKQNEEARNLSKEVEASVDFIKDALVKGSINLQ